MICVCGFIIVDVKNVWNVLWSPSVPIACGFVLLLLEFLQNCETKSGTERLGVRSGEMDGWKFWVLVPVCTS